MTPFYRYDIENGIITCEEAKEYLQELFLMIQAATNAGNVNFTRGGESHFCIGGYLADGSDGFNEVSYLIVESLMELPTYIPQVTLRWTEKTPHEVLRFMMNAERNDKNKRIAFTNDEKLFTMRKLVDALKADWHGYEDMRNVIIKKGKFFGNDDDLSNSVAQRLYESFYDYLKDKRNVFGYHWLIGDLLGYNEHHKWFGEKTKATPDGRFAGGLLKFGIGQSDGRDRNGLTALLKFIALLDKNAIFVWFYRYECFA